MVHKNASEYTHSFAHSNWRILVQNDHNDLVIAWQHKHEVNGKLKLVGMGHIDQTCHATYHAHMTENDKNPIDIGYDLDDTEKLQKGMMFLKSRAKEHTISYEDDYLSPEDVHMQLMPQILNQTASNGTRSNSVSVNATAAIITADGDTSSISSYE